MQHDPYTYIWLLERERERAMAARAAARLARGARTDDLGRGRDGAGYLLRRLRAVVAVAVLHVLSSVR